MEEHSDTIQTNLKSIGSKVKELRKAKNKNYESFCLENGLNKVSLNRMENGKDFKMSNFLKILEIFEVSVEDFFNELGEPKDSD